LQDKIRQMAEDFEKHSAKTSEYLQSVIDENASRPVYAATER